MFNKKTKKEEVPNVRTSSTSNSATTTNGATCVIAKGTRIEGKFTTTEDVRLDGTVIGEMVCKKRVVMGNTGRVEGNVRTMDSAIRGKIKGEIKVSGTLHLHETANVDGIIIARKMVVDSGAQYSGDIKVGDQHFGK